MITTSVVMTERFRRQHITDYQNSLTILTIMLTTIAVVLIALWLLGVVTSYTIGGFIHILLVVAVIMILVRLIRGQQVL